MGIIRRLARLWRAQRTEAAGEAALERLCAQLETHLAVVREQLATSLGEEHRLSALLTTAQQMAEHMLRRARQALQAGDESLAREAITRHLQEERQSRTLARMLTDERANVHRLQLLRGQIEDRLIDMQHSLLQHRMRRQQAQTRHALTETLHGERNRWQVEHAEEQLRAEEYTTDAYQALAARSHSESDEPLDAVAIEQALAALRHELELPGPGKE